MSDYLDRTPLDIAQLKEEVTDFLLRGATDREIMNWIAGSEYKHRAYLAVSGRLRIPWENIIKVNPSHFFAEYKILELLKTSTACHLGELKNQLYKIRATEIDRSYFDIFTSAVKRLTYKHSNKPGECVWI